MVEKSTYISDGSLSGKTLTKYDPQGNRIEVRSYVTPQGSGAPALRLDSIEPWEYTYFSD